MRTKGLDAVMKRPPEEAFLFNPAFMASLLFAFAKDFTKQNAQPPSLALGVIATSATLHGPTRRRFPTTTFTQLGGWLLENDDVLIGFADRARGILPFVRTGAAFGVAHGVLKDTAAFSLENNSSRGGFTLGFLEDSTAEVREIVGQQKFAGRWFAKSGSQETILANWGVAP